MQFCKFISFCKSKQTLKTKIQMYLKNERRCVPCALGKGFQIRWPVMHFLFVVPLLYFIYLFLPASSLVKFFKLLLFALLMKYAICCYMALLRIYVV